MKKILISAIVISLAMCSCQDQPYIYVEKTVHHTKTLVYNIDKSGEITGSTNLWTVDIVKALTDDLNGQLDKMGYTIKELTIQAVSLELTKNAANTANTLVMSATVSKPNQTIPPTLLIRQNNIPVSADAISIANAYLMLDGVDEINKELAKVVKNLGFSSYLLFQIKGNPIPSNSRVSAQLKINITFNMQYSYCEESLLFFDGPYCI